MIFLMLALLALPITWFILILVFFSGKVKKIIAIDIFLIYCGVLAIISLPVIYDRF